MMVNVNSLYMGYAQAQLPPRDSIMEQVRRIEEMPENITIWQFMRDSLNDTIPRTELEQIALCVCFALYTVIGIFGNALVLFSIWRLRKWSGLENAMMCFLTNLAISDFLLCSLTFPATAISAAVNRWILGVVSCWVVGFIVSYLRIVSILFMMWIGIHRALVIKYPFNNKITKKGAVIISVFVWTLSTIPQLTCFAGIAPLHFDPIRAVCLASLLSKNVIAVAIYSGIYLVIPMALIISVYSLLLVTAIKAIRHTKTLSELSNNNPPDEEGPPRRGGMTPAHRRAFGTVFAQIGGFLLCFLPFVIFVGLKAVKVEVPIQLQAYGACSSSMSAIINPLIYMNTNNTFKKFVLSFLRCEGFKKYNGQTTFLSQAKLHSALEGSNGTTSAGTTRFFRASVVDQTLLRSPPWRSPTSKSTFLTSRVPPGNARNSRSISMVTPPSSLVKQLISVKHDQLSPSPRITRSQSDPSLMESPLLPRGTSRCLVMANHQKVSFAPTAPEQLGTTKTGYGSGAKVGANPNHGILRANEKAPQSPFINVQPRVSVTTGMLYANSRARSSITTLPQRERRVSHGDVALHQSNV